MPPHHRAPGRARRTGRPPGRGTGPARLCWNVGEATDGPRTARRTGVARSLGTVSRGARGRRRRLHRPAPAEIERGEQGAPRGRGRRRHAACAGQCRDRRARAGRRRRRAGAPAATAARLRSPAELDVLGEPVLTAGRDWPPADAPARGCRALLMSVRQEPLSDSADLPAAVRRDGRAPGQCAAEHLPVAVASGAGPVAGGDAQPRRAVDRCPAAEPTPAPGDR